MPGLPLPVSFPSLLSLSIVSFFSSIPHPSSRPTSDENIPMHHPQGSGDELTGSLSEEGCNEGKDTREETVHS
eukprot:1584026-Rhodomonas_salina.1